MGRSPCCAKDGLNRGAWTAMEDKILTDYIKANGEGKWRNLPKRAGLKRCGKSCRLRWLNYLRPDIKRGNISADEEELIIRLHKLLGNRWSLIAGRLPGRTDNEIKNYWNTNLSKRLHTNEFISIAAAASTTRPTPKHHHLGSNITKSKKKTNNKSSKTNTALPISPHKDTVLIRTKAVRCTKVFLGDLTLPPPPSVPSQLPAPPLVKTVSEAAAASTIPNPKILPVPTNVNDAVPAPSYPFPSDHHNRYYHDDQISGTKLTAPTVGSSSDLTTMAETETEPAAGMMADSCCLDFNFLDLLDSSTYLSDICSFDFSPQQHHLTAAAAGDSHSDNNRIDGGGVMYHHSTSTLSSSEEEVEEQPIVFSEEMMEDWRRSDCAGAALSCYDIIL